MTDGDIPNSTANDAKLAFIAMKQACQAPWTIVQLVIIVPLAQQFQSNVLPAPSTLPKMVWTSTGADFVLSESIAKAKVSKLPLVTAQVVISAFKLLKPKHQQIMLPLYYLSMLLLMLIIWQQQMPMRLQQALILISLHWI